MTLAETIKKYSDIGRSEKVRFGRLIARLSSRILPEASKPFRGLYTYVRILDDVADEASEIEPSLALLRSEKNAWKNGRQTSLQAEIIGGSLERLDQKKKDRINLLIPMIIEGLSCDAIVRKTQVPMNKTQLAERSYLDLWPEIAVTAMLFLNYDPGSGQQVKKLMDTWGTYDNISDLGEDLSHGLVLISREDMRKWRLKFTASQEPPTGILSDFYRSKRLEVVGGFVRYSTDIFKSGLPLWVCAFDYCYFQSRNLKLLGSSKTEDSFTYQPPSDALRNFCSAPD